MKTIWKYELMIHDEQIVDLPKNAEILTIQNLQGNQCLWALVSPANETEPRTIVCRDTGHDIDFPNFTLQYISSAQFYNGDVVFHYFEKLPL